MGKKKNSKSSPKKEKFETTGYNDEVEAFATPS